MLFSFLTASTLLFASASAKGGGRGGGGGGGGGGSGGGGARTIVYSEDECLTTYLGPVYDAGNATDGHTDGPSVLDNYWAWIDDVYTYSRGGDQTNNATINYLTTLHPNVSWQMEVLDAYYNGTFTLTLTPPSSNITYSACPTLKSQTIPNAFLRLGPQSNRNVSRQSYGDKNSYYFHFGRTISGENCPYTANKAFINFESSNDELENPQAWTVSQKKNGDKFELGGELTSTLAQYNNFWNYVVNTTGTDSPYNASCPTLFSLRTLMAGTGAKMNATVSASEASMQFEFTDTQFGYVISGSFTGQHWAEGPKILFDKDAIQTEGDVPHVKPRAPKKGFMEKYGKYIIIAACVVGVLIILYVLWHFFLIFVGCLRCLTCGWFSCLRNKKSNSNEALESKWSSSRDLEQQNTSYVDKQPTTSVMAMEPQHTPTTEVSYQVGPLVAESFAITGGEYYQEITNAQNELHKAHQDLQAARLRGDADAVVFGEAMVGHHTGVIEHFMARRKVGM